MSDEDDVLIAVAGPGDVIHSFGAKFKVEQVHRALVVVMPA